MRFLGLAGRGRVAAMRDFVADTGTGAMTHLVDADGALWQRFGVFGQPSFAFVARDGTVRTYRGSLDPAELRAAADELLAR
ncbi:MAG: TlpA family protein disulfide reductase [Pseudonocardia sp.]